ncbi:SusC/RagA family TonB-linked outer membrane protein [Hymenobacter mucosus]|uniref:TonB-linked outer membrane protein, SusC/RagA family n=1 Tax=Hymenobacter mucosus TaxID=1411120 RepID=A0A239AKA7_9BACT|nr:TonB-dependent receptor [Hymenobacter mucosus]SNR95989.1 TonB-linked outer membrane protein, SusC/RagA family [Hymenobacter mucosus]
MLTSLAIRNWRGAPLLLLGSATALPLTPAWARSDMKATAARVDVTVQGRVTDDKGAPLPGATIIVKGASGLGASSDAEGNFSLTLPTGNETLVVSSIGFVAQEISVEGRTTLTIKLVTDNKALDEVVVVGYGTQRRSDVTGAVGSVKSSEILERPVVNVAQSLQGRVTGVDVSLNSGQPGSSPTIRVRGYSSITAGNTPLYVVDGIFWEAGITALNPADIESIEVLKDASATAIYGSRGSSGVIIVTTKRGRKGGQISYDNFFSVSKIARKLDVLNAQEFLAAEDLAYQNVQKFDPAGWAAGKYTNRDPRIKRRALVGKLFDDQLNPLYDVDWQDEVTQTAVSQSHNLGFTGGGDQTTYGLFLNYTNANGTIKNTYQKRYSARLVVDNQVKKWLKVGATVNYSNIEDRIGNNFVGGNNVPRMMIEMIPIVPIQYPDGTYGKRQDYPDMEGGDNPVALTREDIQINRNQIFAGNAFFNITFMPGLDFRSVAGANITSSLNPSFGSNLVQLRGGTQNVAGISAVDNKLLQWQNYLTYNKQFNELHSINLVAGTETRRERYFAESVETRGLPDNAYLYYNLGTGATPSPPASSFDAAQFLSFFGRANYSFKDRYLLTATYRIDGASRFGANNKYVQTPSAALAWRVSQEDFLRDNSVISDLKLRFGFGRTANSSIGNYQSQARLGTNSYIFNGVRATGTTISTLANPDLQWEEAMQYDLGLNLSLWQNRVAFEADVYRRNTDRLLLAAPVPRTSGYGSITTNIGGIRNEGLELGLNTVNVDSKNFTWSTVFNISFLKNRVLALGSANDDIFPGPNFLNETNVLRVGQPVGSLFGLEREGTWSSAEADEARRYNRLPGDLKFKDQNNDGQINDRDRVILGKSIPTGYGTFSNTLRYLNVDLTVDLQFTYGNDVMDLTHHSALDRTGQANSYTRAVTEAWTPDNQNTSIAQVRPSYLSYDSRIDSYKVQDGSFIRGRNLVLGYTFPSSTLEAIKLSRLRLYVSAQNFFLLTKYKGYDPETSTYTNAFAQGIQFFDYPKARTVTAGLNVSF